MGRAGEEDVIKPKSDDSERRARGNHGARKRNGILPQKIDGLRPVSDTFSQTHLETRLSLLFCAPGHRYTLCFGAGSTAMLDNFPAVRSYNGGDEPISSTCGYKPPSP